MDADVVVIGAGAAGIAAALALAERSLRVIVLEPRDRIGGRVMWATVGSVEEPAELGPEFIHGEAPETSQLLREAGLEKIETDGEQWAGRSEGALDLAKDDFGATTIFERARFLAEDCSVDAFLRPLANDPETAADARRAREFVEGFEAADPVLASVRSIAAEIGTGIDATSSRPVGSYAPLFEHLAARLERARVELRLGTTVRHVRYARGAVAIDASTSAETSVRFTARCAIVTVPVGVLRDDGTASAPAFAPPLPAPKRDALRGLEMGHVVRVVMSFRTPFWEAIAGGRYRDAAFFRCAAGPYTAFWAQLPLRGRTIVAWAGGPRATAMAAASRDERVARALDEFGALLGESERARREFEAAVTHDWSADPYARGAYSYVATGATDARALLAAPIDDTLFFAGEATSTDGQGGTVSGAFGSGARAASEAARALERPGAPSRIAP